MHFCRVPKSNFSLNLQPWHLLALCVVVLLSVPQAHALDPNRLIAQYGHTVWRVQDGFVEPNTSIAQLSNGSIVMVGEKSVYLFDGVRFVPIVLPDILKLGGVNVVFGSRDGTLWLGGGTAFGRLKDGKMTILTDPKDLAGTSNIIEDHAGNIWYSRYYIRNGEGAICKVVGDGIRCFGPKDGVPAKYVYAINEDREGYLWFVGAYIYHWKPGTKAIQYLDGFKHPDMGDLAVDRAGNVWTGMETLGPHLGVGYLHNGTWNEFRAGNFHSASVNALGFHVDRDGSVWVGTVSDGLYRFAGRSVDHFSKADGLSGNTVVNFLEDREGNLWVSTDGGVDMFRNIPVTNYAKDQGLTNAFPAAVMATSDGVVWASAHAGANQSSVDARADILPPGPNQRFGSGPMLPGKIETMLQDHAGALWFGLFNSVAVYDHGKVKKVLAQDGQGLQTNDTASMLEDSTGAILVLSKTNLYRIRDRRVQEQIPLPEPLSHYGLMAADQDGGILIADDRHIMRYKDGLIRNYALPGGQSSSEVMGMTSDADDPLMLTTFANGLLRWNGKQWQHLDEKGGLPCNTLFSALKDRHGSLWIESKCGLLKVEAAELEKWRRSGAQPGFRVFDELDGASTNRYFTVQPQMSLAPDGRVWYANGKSIQSIAPDRLFDNPLPPPVQIEQIIADGKVYASDGHLHIPPNPRNLEIDYTAPSFTVPQRVRFRYRLEGHDSVWQEPLTRRQAFYTDLPPGKYHFHVIACNNSGVWNESGAAATFVVEPTFYQTLWFRTLLGLAIAGVLWTLYLLRMKQATANAQKRLLAQMEERERIARELHDTLLQGFQGIALQVQGVTKTIPAQDPLRAKMESVLDRADEVLLEGRQRVRDLRQRTANEEELPARLTKYGEKLAEDHATTFSLAIVGTPMILESTAQDEAYRIAAEALTNAFRHASASEIEVEITYDSSGLRIRVRDDGAGIDSAVLVNGHPGHWGLAGMRERAHAIRAEFNIWSREAAGTEVELVIPASIAYPRKQKAAANGHLAADVKELNSVDNEKD